MAGREIMSNKLKINYRISKKIIGKVNNSFKISYQKFYEALNLLIKSRKLLIDNFNWSRNYVSADEIIVINKTSKHRKTIMSSIL